MISHILSATCAGTVCDGLFYGLESRLASRFCPALRFLMIIPSCCECNNLRNDLDKKEDMAFIGQSGGTIERI